MECVELYWGFLPFLLSFFLFFLEEIKIRKKREAYDITPKHNFFDPFSSVGPQCFWSDFLFLLLRLILILQMFTFHFWKKGFILFHFIKESSSLFLCLKERLRERERESESNNDTSLSWILLMSNLEKDGHNIKGIKQKVLKCSI